MAELIGQHCGACRVRINWVGDSRFCAVCRRAVHNACAKTDKAPGAGCHGCGLEGGPAAPTVEPSEGAQEYTTEIRYDADQTAFWSAVYFGSALLCGGLVAFVLYGVVQLIRLPGKGDIAALLLLTSACGVFGVWLLVRAGLKYWRLYCNRAPVLTPTLTGLRDARCPSLEVWWADVEHLNWRTVTTNGWETTALIEIQAALKSPSISVTLNVLSLDRSAEVICGLMQRYVDARRRHSELIGTSMDSQQLFQDVVIQSVKTADKRPPEAPTTTGSVATDPVEERLLCPVCGFRYLKLVGECLKCKPR